MMRYEIFVVDKDRRTGHGIVVGAPHGAAHFEEFRFNMGQSKLLNIRKFDDPQFHVPMRLNFNAAEEIYRIAKHEMENAEAARDDDGNAARATILRPMVDKLRVMCAVADMSSKSAAINDAERAETRQRRKVVSNADHSSS